MSDYFDGSMVQARHNARAMEQQRGRDEGAAAFQKQSLRASRVAVLTHGISVAVQTAPHLFTDFSAAQLAEMLASAMAEVEREGR